MSAQPAPFNRDIARRFVGAVRDLLTSEVRRKAIGLLVLAVPVRHVGQRAQRREQLRRPRLHDGDCRPRHGGLRQICCSVRRRVCSNHRSFSPVSIYRRAPGPAMACLVDETAPGVYTAPVPASFDRSWSAALGAFGDQGVRVTSQDRGAGQIRGTRDDINVTANVRTQADGSVRVEFNTSGDTARDPKLIDRISHAYDRLMGR